MPKGVYLLPVQVVGVGFQRYLGVGSNGVYLCNGVMMRMISSAESTDGVPPPK
jgi:hypothetical protein